MAVHEVRRDGAQGDAQGARESVTADDHRGRAVPRDLGHEAAQRISFDQLRLESVQRRGLRAVPVERGFASTASASSTCAMRQPAWTAIEESFTETSVSVPIGR